MQKSKGVEDHQRQAEINRVWDYAGSLYPDGNLDTEHAYLFDGEQIENLIFVGYRDAMELEYNKALAEAKEKLIEGKHMPKEAMDREKT